MKARLERIALLARSNRAHKLLPSVVKGLSETIGVAVYASCFASLERTDYLRMTFRQRYASCSEPESVCYRRYFEPNSEVKVFALATCFANAIPDDRVWLLLTQQADHCGAVLLEPWPLLSKAKEVIALDGDSVCLISENEQEGLLLDYNADDFEWTFELTAWGDRWPLLLNKCDPKPQLSTDH